MKKRVIGVIITIVLVITSVFAYTQFNKEANIVFAAEFRNGYSVEPLSMDTTGVKVDSKFLFKWEEESERVSVDQLIENLSISPELEVSIEETEDGLLISPQMLLEANRIYVYEYKGTTWAYKTEADFELIGTFPRNQATNVPVNTGIELIFNYEGANVEDFFEIEPAVKGSFEQHGRVVAFVPKALEGKTVYTITLKEGLELKGSDKTISESFSFSFETLSVKEEKQSNGYINFSSIINEFKTDEVPSIGWDFYMYNDKYEKNAEVKVYAYNDVEEFMTDLDSYNHMPYWSFYGAQGNGVEVDKLKEVMDFEYELVDDGSYPQFLNLPETLKQGFYVVDVVWEDMKIQTFIQITDLSFYYTQNTNGDLFWIHDQSTGDPVEGAVVTKYDSLDEGGIVKTDVVETSNREGTASFIGERNLAFGETRFYHLQKDDKQSVLFSMNNVYWSGSYGQESNYFWKYFKSDRSLYQPDDTVEFFGYLKGRYENVNLEKVSVEITRGGYYYYDFLPYNIDSLSYVVEEVDVENGFFKGDLQLPNLQEGSYEIVVKNEGERVASTYISVENYVKPSYKMEVNTDKKAIFVDEPIKYTINSQFFEGTPVSFLDFNYNIGGLDYKEGSGSTDKKGEADITFTPKYQSGFQGVQYYYFSAYAELPETGSIYVNDEFRVFFNDIYVSPEAKLEGEKGILSIQANYITLDRINSEENEDASDFLDQPTSDLVIKGEIIRNEWIKTETGEYYDFINKEVRKQYDYNLEKTTFDSVTLTTDNEGIAELNIDLPKVENVYYTGELSTKDSKARNMEYTVYFGDYRRYEPNQGDYYHMEVDQTKYEINETIEATFKNGNQAHVDGQYLFIASQNGVIDYKVNDGSSISMEFKESYMPNIEIAGVYYNGNTYIEADRIQATYDYSLKSIDLLIKTDNESYKPGEEVTLTIEATTMVNGEKVKVSDALVNLGLIDEALLALSEQYVDPLAELYRFVDAGVYQTYSSHMNQNGNFGGLRGYGAVTEESAEMAMDTSSDGGQTKLDFSATDEAKTTESANSISVRSEFKDTAVFITLKLDESGKGEYSFTLPDNVTSWRMTGAAISNELKAGSQVEAVNVSLPFFLNTSISSTYLVGDEPMIGVTAYGSELDIEEQLSYIVEVYNAEEQLTNRFEAVSGAFERVNLPLGALMKAGNYKVVVKGVREDGSGDGVEIPVEVVKTYHEQLTSDYYALSDGFTLTTNNAGNTLLTFVDEGKGYYLPGLYNLAYSNGKRVDQKYLGKLVQEYLNKYFGGDRVTEDVSITDYLTYTGGIGILPYAEADIETTVNMLPFIGEDVSELTLGLYLENAWYDKAITEKGPILYGLTVLGESVMNDLNTYAKVKNLNAKDKLYLSMAYNEIGDTYMAKKIYEEVIGDHVVEFDERAYVNLSELDYENIEYTAMAMVIADKIGLEIHDKFYDYLLNNQSKEVLVNTYLFNYISSRLEQVSQAEGSLVYTYNGSEQIVELDHGYGKSISIPSATLKQFRVTSVTGDLAVIAAYNVPLTNTVTNDDKLGVSRKYYNYQTGEQTNTFKEGDLVKVELEWEVQDDAIDNYYRLSDYAPAGLKPIDNPWQLGLRNEGSYFWYRDVDGQKVDFYIYKDTENHTYESLVYFARIVSLGEYKSEAPIIQGTTIKDSMFIGKTDSIIIND